MKMNFELNAQFLPCSVTRFHCSIFSDNINVTQTTFAREIEVVSIVTYWSYLFVLK